MPLDGVFVQNLQFDFFNYAGIQHRVLLYSVPAAHIQDMLLLTAPASEGSSQWTVMCNINVTGNPQEFDVQLLDKSGTLVAQYNSSSSDFVLKVDNPKLWWPWTMAEYGEVAYLYTLQVCKVMHKIYTSVFCNCVCNLDLTFYCHHYRIRGFVIKESHMSLYSFFEHDSNVLCTLMSLFEGEVWSGCLPPVDRTKDCGGGRDTISYQRKAILLSWC